MKSVSYFKRIGIEAEIHTYNLDETIRNKVVLAESRARISDGADIDLPYMKIVSEGASTRCRYLELVFGPVKDNEAAEVKGVLSVALGIGCNAVRSVASWVQKFNKELLAKKYGPMVLYSKYALELKYDCPLKWARCKTVSIQANILTPIELFYTENKVRRFFFGVPDNLFKYAFVQQKLRACFPNKQRVCGLLFIAAYFCVIYSYHNALFGQETLFGVQVSKQDFPILPKIDLAGFWREVMCQSETPDPFEVLLGFKDMCSYRSSVYQKNVELLQSFIEGTRSVAPRTDAVLPSYASSAGPCIVLEMRKNQLTLLREIQSFMTDSSCKMLPDIW